MQVVLCKKKGEVTGDRIEWQKKLFCADPT